MYLRHGAANFMRKLRNYPSDISVYSLLKKTTNSSNLIGDAKISGNYDFGSKTKGWRHTKVFQWIFMSGQAAIFLGINASLAFAEDVSNQPSTENPTGVDITGLRKIEDGSVLSNIHTAKWRVFTDTGRDYFLQGKLPEAERLLVSALKEAREGFGEGDPHVASACNNLAELYRVKKDFSKAEPLYLEAIRILEEYFGPDDIRVGAALHNLGQFYLVQRKLEDSRTSYEHALKIKKRVLGEDNDDYADTMYHLGNVFYLEGKEKDSVALIRNSIQILEAAGLGESIAYLRRLQHLSKIYLKSNQLAEAESIQRKILHIMELSKGWSSFDTVIAAEQLAQTLYAMGNLSDSEELLERCIASRKKLLCKDHIENASNMLYIARVKILKSQRLQKTDSSQAMVELDKAKSFLWESQRVARAILVGALRDRENKQPNNLLKKGSRHEKLSMLILLQSLNALGELELQRMKLKDSRENHLPSIEAETTFRQCMSAFKEFGTKTATLRDSPEVKAEYLSCLNQLFTMITENEKTGSQNSVNPELEELKDEINRVQADLSSTRRHRS